MVGLNISILINKLFLFFLRSKQQPRKGNECMSRNRPTFSKSATEHALKQEVKVAWKQLKKNYSWFVDTKVSVSRELPSHVTGT